eukprot:GHVT01041234.1.p1 GENE.GHVT01041234.1~~GHVT01041234.1.p1  ORF type:complete len:171 (+),score=12.07 GHVT01041234.1:1207-1719(+)
MRPFPLEAGRPPTYTRNRDGSFPLTAGVLTSGHDSGQKSKILSQSLTTPIAPSPRLFTPENSLTKIQPGSSPAKSQQEPNTDAKSRWLRATSRAKDRKTSLVNMKNPIQSHRLRRALASPHCSLQLSLPDAFLRVSVSSPPPSRVGLRSLEAPKGRLVTGLSHIRSRSHT